MTAMRANSRGSFWRIGRGTLTLIRLRGDDGADEELHVVLVGHELGGQLVQQLRMAGGVLVGRFVVDGVDDADAEEMGPEAIGPGAGEVRVGRRGDPLRQRVPAFRVVLPVRRLAIEEAGLDDLVGAWNLQLTAPSRIGDLPGRLAGCRHRIVRQAVRNLNGREERGEFPELLAGPPGKRMIVALGTLKTNAQEPPGRAGCQAFGLVRVGFKKIGTVDGRRRRQVLLILIVLVIVRIIGVGVVVVVVVDRRHDYRLR